MKQAYGAMGQPLRTNLPYETNCVIKYSTWPLSGLTVVNAGNGGVTYNATAAHNDIITLNSTAKAWQFGLANDNLQLTGSATDNLSAHTMEFLYRPDADVMCALFGKFNAAWSGISYSIIVVGGQVRVDRRDTTAGYGAPYNLWGATTTTLTLGNWYDIQVAADWSNTTNVPAITINGAVQALDDLHSGTVTSYMTDAGGTVQIGSWGGSVNAGTLALFRLHTGILTSAQLERNRLADIWEVGALGP